MKNRIKNQDRQSGVTLLLAILVFASILAISFSLTTILFIEVRSSSDLLKTEGSLYGATGIGEQALFDLKRSVCPGNDQTCLSGTYTTSFQNSVSVNGQPTVVGTSSAILQGKVPTNSIFASTLNKYDFCNGSATTTGCGYGKVTVNYFVTGISNPRLYAYLCEYDPSPSATYPSAVCTKQNTVSPTVDQIYWKDPTSGGAKDDTGAAV